MQPHSSSCISSDLSNQECSNRTSPRTSTSHRRDNRSQIGERGKEGQTQARGVSQSSDCKESTNRSKHHQPRQWPRKERSQETRGHHDRQQPGRSPSIWWRNRGVQRTLTLSTTREDCGERSYWYQRSDYDDELGSTTTITIDTDCSSCNTRELRRRSRALSKRSVSFTWHTDIDNTFAFGKQFQFEPQNNDCKRREYINDNDIGAHGTRCSSCPIQVRSGARTKA